MFITVIYKEPAELSAIRRTSQDFDISVEKPLLVNPVCHVRVMLDYIRNVCNLGIFTIFDLCDDAGVLRGLFNIQPYEYTHNLFENAKVYYVVVFKPEIKQPYSPIPQLNWENPLHNDLTQKIKLFITAASLSSSAGKTTPKSAITSPPKSMVSSNKTVSKNKAIKSATSKTKKLGG